MKTYITLLFFLCTCLSVQAQDKNVFKPKSHKINGYNINVETKGKGNPIVFIAGGPGNSHDYLQGNFGHYHKKNQVVFFDGLGRGLSEDAKDNSEYTVDNDVEILESIRKALKIKKWSVVGHSYGTLVAQAYVLKYPEAIEKMVLINGFHSGLMWQEANCDTYNFYSKTHFPEKWRLVDSLRKEGFVSSDPEFKEVYGSFPTKYIYYHNTELIRLMPPDAKRTWSDEVYYTMVGRDGDFHVTGCIGDIDFRRQLKDVKVPTLIVAGRYDGVSTPEYALQYKQFMPQAQFVMFEKSGHNPYLEEARAFSEVFDKFMKIK